MGISTALIGSIGEAEAEPAITDIDPPDDTLEALYVAGSGSGKPTLKEKRLQLALSMNELATAASVSASTVMDIERGASPRMATIRKLARALGCAPQDIAWPGDPFGIGIGGISGPADGESFGPEQS